MIDTGLPRWSTIGGLNPGPALAAGRLVAGVFDEEAHRRRGVGERRVLNGHDAQPPPGGWWTRCPGASTRPRFDDDTHHEPGHSGHRVIGMRRSRGLLRRQWRSRDVNLEMTMKEPVPRALGNPRHRPRDDRRTGRLGQRKHLATRE